MKHLASSWRFSQLVGTVPTCIIPQTNKLRVLRSDSIENSLVNRKNPKDFCK